MRDIVLTGNAHVSGRECDGVGFAACPFCGGADFYITDKDDFDFLERKYGKASIYIRCRSCEVEMWEHSFTEEGYGNRLRLLAENWNRRVSV